jgi:hypothetical protein
LKLKVNLATSDSCTTNKLTYIFFGVCAHEVIASCEAFFLFSVTLSFGVLWSLSLSCACRDSL